MFALSKYFLFATPSRCSSTATPRSSVGSATTHNNGAAWVFSRSGAVWSQQGDKLVGVGAIGHAEQGFSAALSADGNTAVVGGIADNRVTGAAWVHNRRDGLWIQGPLLEY